MEARRMAGWAGWGWILCAALWAPTWRAPAAEDAGVAAGLTGLKEESPAGKRWLKRMLKPVARLRPNRFALERVNAERLARGQALLREEDVDLAELGQEAQFGGEARRGAAIARATLPAAGGVAPGSVDNSLLQAFPPIRSQAVASCVGWASTYYLLTYETALVRGWDAKNGGDLYRFSPKWTYTMINGGVDGGAYFSDALNLLLKHGAARWSEFPENSNFREWCLSSSAWRQAIQSRIVGQGNLYNSDPAVLIDQLRQHLANAHLVFVGTYINSWEQRLVGNDPATSADDVYAGQKICRFMSSSRSGGHAMTLVGYNDNLWCDVNLNGVVDSGEKGAFKVANSWGTGDWNGGFRWVAYDALRPVSAVAGGPGGREAIFTTNGWPTWITVSAGYVPQVLAEFSVNHLKRNQLRIVLGLGGTTQSTPASRWTPAMLNLQGGAYAFNGTTTAVDGTFFLDFKDLSPSLATLKRYFVGVYDSTTGDPVTLKTFRLTDGNGNPLGSATGLPLTADGGQERFAWVDYVDASNSPPTAVATASSSSGSAPLAVTFDGSSSSDADGTIVSYSWNFGDGSSANGLTATHTYTVAGSYTATLTVTDDKGATGSNSLAITVSAGAAGKLHVWQIVMAKSGNASGTKASARVYVVDAAGAPRSGATVSGNWSGLVVGAVSGITGSDGSITFFSAKTKKHGTFTFTVSAVSQSGYTYDSAANGETSDSIGW